SDKYAEDSVDAYYLFASNTPAITDLGLSAEESRTTLAPKSRRLDDAAFWIASNMTTSAVAGVDGVSASATRLVAAANNATITGPTTSLSSNPRRLDPFVRRVAGTGNIDL